MPKAHKLPKGLRTKLSKPLGNLFNAGELEGKEFVNLVKESAMLITVGDRVTETVGAAGRVPDVQVVDSKENRKAREPPSVPYATLVRSKNPAGGLTEETLDAVKSAMAGKKPARLLVDGEEDLVAVPVIAFAPVSAVVLYGQPGVGIVAVRADARAKSRSRKILSDMGFSGPL